MTDRLSAVASALLKQFGPRSSGQGGLGSKMVRISTGSLDLDLQLGGGFPVGRVVSFFGEKSGGKSTTAQRIGGIFQKLCRRCLRPATNLGANPPTKAELEENPYARWTGTGQCDCFAAGLWSEPEPKKDGKEKTDAYKARVEKWRADLEANSYQETIVAYIDPEDAFDPVWAETLGVDPRKLFLGRSGMAEESVDMITALMASGAVDLCIVDSLAHFVPRKEYEDSAESWQQGLAARITNKGVRKWIAGMAYTKRQGHDPSMIWINQVREKINAFGDPTVKPSGKGQEFAASVEIKFGASKQEIIEEQYGGQDDKLQIPINETLRFKCTKNKTKPGCKGLTGKYVQLTRATDAGPAGTIVEDEYLFKLAMHYLVKVEAKGSTKKYLLNGKAFASQKAILVALREDKVLFNEVRTEMLQIMLSSNGQK